MRIGIEGFKSIEAVSLELGTLTVVMGPPASGKSNLLEALATLGYTIKAALGEADIRRSLGPLNRYVRALSCGDLIYRHKLRRSAAIRTEKVSLELACEPEDPIHSYGRLVLKPGGAWEPIFELWIPVRGKSPRLLSDTYRSLSRRKEAGKESDDLDKFLAFIDAFRDLLDSVQEGPRVKVKLQSVQEPVDSDRVLGEIVVPSIRLYSFDRLHVLLTIMHNRTYRHYPYYLAEDASNLGYILYYHDDILSAVNEVLREYSGVEVKPLSDGGLAFFDGGREVGPASISDTLLRILYYYTALYTSMRIRETIQINDVESNITYEPLILLEEPESHFYPVAYRSFLEPVRRAIENGARIVVSTHSGRLATLLSDEIPGSVVYLLDRDRGGSTRVYRVRTDKLAERLEDLEDLVFQPRRYIPELLDEGILVTP